MYIYIYIYVKLYTDTCMYSKSSCSHLFWMFVQAGEPVEWRPLSLRFASLDFCGLIGGDSNEISFHIFRVCSPDFTIQVMEFIPLAPVPYCDFQSEA